MRIISVLFARRVICELGGKFTQDDEESRWEVSEDKIDCVGHGPRPPPQPRAVVVPSFVSIEEVDSVELQTSEGEEEKERAEEVLSATTAGGTGTLSPARRKVRLTSITEVIEENDDDFDDGTFTSPCQSITLKCDIKIIVTSYDDDDDGDDARGCVPFAGPDSAATEDVLPDHDEFESAAESPTDFLDDECERLSSNFADTDTEDDKPAISDEDLELVDISSDEDDDDEFESLRLERLRREKDSCDAAAREGGDGGRPFTVDIFQDWIKNPAAAVFEAAVDYEAAVEAAVNSAAASLPPQQPPPGEASPEKVVAEDEYEHLRLRRVRGDDRGRGGRGREAAPERDVVEDDTETAEFQSRLRKLSNPSAVPPPPPGPEAQDSQSTDEVEPQVPQPQEPERVPDPGRAPEISNEEPAAAAAAAEDASPASAVRRSKSRDLFEIKRRNKQQGAKPPPPPPAGRRGSWHLESVDELTPLVASAAGPIEKLQEEEEEEEEGEGEAGAEEEEKNSSSGSKEASPGNDGGGGKNGSPPPRLFR